MTRRTWHTCQPADLLKLARRRFLHDRRIELQRLSQELGISRATAYRWVGNAEHLGGMVMASLADDTFRRVVGEAEGEGVDRLLDVIERVMKYAHAFLPLRHFLEHNPQMGMRIVASENSDVRRHTIDQLSAILDDEVTKGHLMIQAEVQEVAFALTCILESFLYTALVAGDPPDFNGVKRVIKLLLHQGAAAAERNA